MTEQVYPRPLQSFKTDMVPTPVFTVPVMAQGAAALEQINEVPTVIPMIIIIILADIMLPLMSCKRRFSHTHKKYAGFAADDELVVCY